MEYPLYHDSAIHYQIVGDLQSLSQPQQFVDKLWKLNSGYYYHVGFHSTIVVLAAQLGGSFNTTQLILITGHMFLILFVLNLGLLASRLFDNSYTGISTVIFAGLGWAMPAHAINWGKYPAISSLAIFPLAVYWMVQAFNSTDKNRRLHIVLYGISALSAILLHSHSLILLGCALAAMVTLNFIWKRLSREAVAVLFCAEIGLILLIFRFHPNFRTALLPYLKGVDLFATVLAVASLFFAARQNTKAAIGILTFLLCVAIISTIPIPESLVNQAGPYLLDRPNLQILFFSPLSLFVGGSLSHSIMELRSRTCRRESGRLLVSIGLLSLTVLAIGIRPFSDFKPNPCCDYMRIDDSFLIGWMEENIPKDSRILISAVEASTDAGAWITLADARQEWRPGATEAATDAGAWITPLTELETIKLDYRTDFSDPAIHAALCQEKIEHIYVSAVHLSFSIPLLEENKKTYSPIIVLPESRLYSVNCHLSSPVN